MKITCIICYPLLLTIIQITRCYPIKLSRTIPNFVISRNIQNIQDNIANIDKLSKRESNSNVLLEANKLSGKKLKNFYKHVWIDKYIKLTTNKRQNWKGKSKIPNTVIRRKRNRKITLTFDRKIIEDEFLDNQLFNDRNENSINVLVEGEENRHQESIRKETTVLTDNQINYTTENNTVSTNKNKTEITEKTTEITTESSKKLKTEELF